MNGPVILLLTIFQLEQYCQESKEEWLHKPGICLKATQHSATRDVILECFWSYLSGIWTVSVTWQDQFTDKAGTPWCTGISQD